MKNSAARDKVRELQSKVTEVMLLKSKQASQPSGKNKLPGADVTKNEARAQKNQARRASISADEMRGQQEAATAEQRRRVENEKAKVHQKLEQMWHILELKDIVRRNSGSEDFLKLPLDEVRARGGAGGVRREGMWRVGCT